LRAQPQRVRRLVRRSGEQNDVCAKGICKFHPHVSQPAEADDADLLALAYLPMTERRISRDSCAQQRCHGRSVFRRDAGKSDVSVVLIFELFDRTFARYLA